MARTELYKRRSYVLVYKTDMKPIEDYVRSLTLFDLFIEFDTFVAIQGEFLNNSDYVVIMAQMWFTPPSNSAITNLIFLNVEHLTEQNRMKHVRGLIETKIPIADYSETNLKLLQSFADQHGVRLYHLPYQYDLSEQTGLHPTATDEFLYDIGIVNADPVTDGETKSKRSKVWCELVNTNHSVCNIKGWGAERDALINQCRIILNVHHFDCFCIFEHVRCDRLLFAGKLVVSESSFDMENLDVRAAVVWTNYADIVTTVDTVLDKFELFRERTAQPCLMKQVVADRKLKLQQVVYEIEAACS